MFHSWNPNPVGARVGDLPNSNNVWGAVLRKRGFHKRAVPDTCPECYTLREFCQDHPDGTYVVAFSGHVCCTQDGCYWDSWDSGSELPVFYWTNFEEE